MSKKLRVMAATFLTVAALLGGAGQADAQYEVVPAYITTMYSDATHSTAVGHLYPDCQVVPYVHVQYTLVGTFTYHTTDQYVGSCGPGGWEPISDPSDQDRHDDPQGPRQ